MPMLVRKRRRKNIQAQDKELAHKIVVKLSKNDHYLLFTMAIKISNITLKDCEFDGTNLTSASELIRTNRQIYMNHHCLEIKK